MLWRHNRVCIAWHKHGNWPITACVRHNLFYISSYINATVENPSAKLVYYSMYLCIINTWHVVLFAVMGQYVLYVTWHKLNCVEMYLVTVYIKQ